MGGTIGDDDFSATSTSLAGWDLRWFPTEWRCSLVLEILWLTLWSCAQSASASRMAHDRELRKIGERLSESPVKYFGWSVSAVGDVDADGTPDLAVGAPSDEVKIKYHTGSILGEGYVETERGSAWVFSGSDFHVLFVWRGDEEGSRFGQCVAAAGDINQDGHADVLVGAPGIPESLGYVRIYSGNDGNEIQTLRSQRPGDGFGACIRASSVDQGGVLIAVGAPQDGDTGSVWLFSGPNLAGFRAAEGSTKGGRFGFSIDIATSLDAESRPEVIVGAPGIETERIGAVFVLSGRTGETRLRMGDPAPGSGFGTCVRFMKNAQAGGGPGIAIGAPWYGKTADYLGGGAVFIYDLRSGEAMRRFTEQLSDQQVDDYRCREESEYGSCIAVLPDRDEDSIEELLVGAPKGFWCGGDVGWAEVISGKVGRSLRFLCWQAEGAVVQLSPFEFASSLDVIGDINRDGWPDVVIGSPDPFGGVQVFSGSTNKSLGWLPVGDFSKKFAEKYPFHPDAAKETGK
jgi:hypothetical protein